MELETWKALLVVVKVWVVVLLLIWTVFSCPIAAASVETDPFLTVTLPVNVAVDTVNDVIVAELT